MPCSEPCLGRLAAGSRRADYQCSRGRSSLPAPRKVSPRASRNAGNASRAARRRDAPSSMRRGYVGRQCGLAGPRRANIGRYHPRDARPLQTWAYTPFRLRLRPQHTTAGCQTIQESIVFMGGLRPTTPAAREHHHPPKAQCGKAGYPMKPCPVHGWIVKVETRLAAKPNVNKTMNLLVILVCLYLFPTIVALLRRHLDWPFILLVNLFMGGR
jgi:hypothetical protein